MLFLCRVYPVSIWLLPDRNTSTHLCKLLQICSQSLDWPISVNWGLCQLLEGAPKCIYLLLSRMTSYSSRAFMSAHLACFSDSVDSFSVSSLSVSFDSVICYLSMISLSWLGCIICELVVSNSYLVFSLNSIDSNWVSMPMREVLVSWGQNCRLLVVDSLPWTVIEYCVINWWSKKKASSRAGKQVHSRGRPQTHCITRYFSRSISASSVLRNPSPEALSSFSSGESEKKSVGSDPKMPTAPRVITGKLSSKRLPPLKLPAAFPEGKASTMS